ncbi:MAG: hypothetical protein JNG89_16885 [Planctomycetaceae bacterium]|nr:hypothetical protein [Planctomycetaceae bacterium]
MKWPWQVSDEEYLDKVRRTLRWRRSLGVFAFVVSLLGCGGVGVVVHTLQTGDLPLYEDPGERISFQIGAMSGFVGGICTFMAAHGLILGLWLCFADRGSRLLLQYRQRLSELGQLPINASDAVNSSPSQSEVE